MIHRRQQVPNTIRTVIMNHHPFLAETALRLIGFESNKYNPSQKSGLFACISSRITTVIHVAFHYQINYNWFNEPFAVSQYNLFILTRAWLNLWDKHMTTGRINQVLSSNREREPTHTLRREYVHTLPQPNPKTPFSFPYEVQRDFSSPISRGVVT